jgi:DNA-binding transcriptional regulator YiaG
MRSGPDNRIRAFVNRQTPCVSEVLGLSNAYFLRLKNVYDSCRLSVGSRSRPKQEKSVHKLWKPVLATGNQLKAARALAEVDQQQVADSAGVNVNTIRNMEARGAKPITSSAVTVRRVQLAL